MKHVDRFMVLCGLLAFALLGAWASRQAAKPAGGGFCGEGGGHCGCAAVESACAMPCQENGCCPEMPCPVDGACR